MKDMPDDPELLCDVGWAHYHKASYKKASKVFKTVLGLQGNSQSALRGCAWASCQTGNYDRAIEIFTDLLPLVSSDDRAVLENVCRGLAWSSFHKNHLDPALDNFLKSLENANPLDTGVMQDLCRGTGWVYLHKGDFSRAEHYFKKAVDNIGFGDRSPTLTDAVNGLERACKGLGKEPSKVIQSLKEAESESQDPIVSVAATRLKNSFLTDMGWAYYLRSNYAEARDRFSEVIRTDPDNETALCGRGWTLLQMSRFDEAIGDFNRALSLASGSARLQEIHRGRGWAYLKSGYYADAIDDFTEALDNTFAGEQHVIRHIHKGRSWAYYGLGMIDKALEDFRNAGDCRFSSERMLRICLAAQVYGSLLKHRLKNPWASSRAKAVDVGGQGGKCDYPVDIPAIEVQPGLDFLLLELPPRYFPIMPNGLG